MSKEMKHITVLPDDFEELKTKKFLVIPHYYWIKEGGRLEKNDQCYVGVNLSDIVLAANVVGANERIVCLERW